MQVELHGGDGNDTLTGGSGVNILLGENGNDTLVGGGALTDHFVGGAGADTIAVASNGGTDYFYDYQDGSDHIDLHNTGLTSFGAADDRQHLRRLELVRRRLRHRHAVGEHGRRRAGWHRLHFLAPTDRKCSDDEAAAVSRVKG